MPNKTRRIKNWDQFQHYKKGEHASNPQWIKVYRRLLEDREWHELDPLAAKTLISLWLLASENGGVLPPLKDICFRLRMPEKQVKSVLNLLPNWLEGEAGASRDALEPVYTPAIIEEEEEEEREEEKEGEGERASRGAHQLPKTWTPSENHFSQAAQKWGFPADVVDDMADAMRFWAWGKGAARKNWDMVFFGWMRRDYEKCGGHGPPRREAQFTDAVQQHMAKVQARAGSNGNSRRDVCGESGKHDLRLVHKSDPEHATDARTIDHAPDGKAENNRGPHVRSEGRGGG